MICFRNRLTNFIIHVQLIYTAHVHVIIIIIIIIIGRLSPFFAMLLSIRATLVFF